MNLGEFLKKWWLPTTTYLLASSPSALVLFYQNILSPHISTLEPQVLLNLVSLLLWLVLLLLAFIILNHPWLKWDEPTGTWVSKLSKLRYCPKCKASKIVTPLKNEITGWRCMNCQHFFNDPARKPKDPSKPPRPSGPNAWMAN
jgi:rubredoxin